MTQVLMAWFGLTIIFAVLAHFAIWARTGQNKPRILSIIGFFAGAALAFVALFMGSGVSLPCMAGYTAPKEKFAVLGFLPVQNVRIDIMFNDSKFGGTRVCYIPWSDKTANSLATAQQKQMQLGMQLGGQTGNGDNNNGVPETFPLHPDDNTEKPRSETQVP